MTRAPIGQGVGAPVKKVRAVKFHRPEITVERGEAMDGRREIWARQKDAPELDALLVTVHYSYAYLSNANIGIVAGRIADLLAGNSEPDQLGAVAQATDPNSADAP